MPSVTQQSMKCLNVFSARVQQLRDWLAVLLLTVLGPHGYAQTPARPAPPILVVTQDGTGTHRSIQAAVDAAPEHARITIGPGTFHERLHITKPLILEGAGWDKTRLVLSDAGEPWDFHALRADWAKRAQEASTDEAQKQVELEMKEQLSVLSHSIAGATQVELRHLSLSMSGKPLEQGSVGAPVLRVRDARLLLAGCVIIGSPGGGLHLESGSYAEVTNCLVAAVWGTGIDVDEGASARIHDSDIRNCYYTGIRIRPKAGLTEIEHCRISGAAWHGVRYDNAAPVIRGNLIFGNARSGIYASGFTDARVSGNLFFRNEMGGMSCWFRNADLIQHNTFVRNNNVGINCLGASTPRVEQNLFCEDAIRTGDIGSQAPYAKAGSGPRQTGNIFWTDRAEAVRLAERHFVGAREFSLKPNSTLRAEGVGAADLIPESSPWPLQAEEKAMIPEGESRDWRGWKRPETLAAKIKPEPPADTTSLAAAPAVQRPSAPEDINPLQRLIDRAAPGGSVVVPEGLYTAPIRINKPLTLAGQDLEACRLEVIADDPAIAVSGEGPVRVENLTIKWQRKTSDQRPEPQAAIYMKDAKAIIENCRLSALGNGKRSPAGIYAEGFTRLTLSGSEFHGFEFAVQYWGGAEGTVKDCMFVDPGHCGITVGQDAKVLVERNIVTGSGYHGIRCTGGHLTARGNLILRNSNRGIYLGNRDAQGEVTDNLILENATGISAFAGSDVRVTRNIIARSSFAGLDLRDTCPLQIDGNVFVENKAGIILFEAAGQQLAGFGRNTFWLNAENTKDLRASGEMLSVDPAFANIAVGDYRLGAAGLREKEQGLADPERIRALWTGWEKLAASPR